MDTPPQKQRGAAPDAMGSGPYQVGETFGDFRILRPLGQGGMGQVYLAEQLSLKRKVAIKVLRPDVAANPTALARFQAESKTLAQLSHSHIVQAHMVGEHEGRHYLVLEYVKGVSLRDYLARQGPLDVPLVLSIMRQVASALQRAGELGIVHRDIKPENILLTRKAEVKVADFGLSRCLDEEPHDLTREGTAVGTPRYMSPEQLAGKPVDTRSDIYSFGITCYEMLAGRPPFDGSNAYEIAFKHVRDEPPPLEKARPDIPEALCAVVHKMLAKKPRDRYPSARELLQDIARVRESVSGIKTSVQPVSIVVESLPEDSSDSVPIVKQPAWHTWALVLGGLGVLGALGLFAVLAVVVALTWSRGQPTPATEPSVVLVPVPGRGAQPTRQAVLEQQVEQLLREAAPNPAGVDTCIELGVLYLEQNKVAEAEALFHRMAERRPPSAYHFVGRLGQAVTDALKNDHRASQAKFTDLFDPRHRDNRAQVLNDYLTRNPELARWVHEADASNARDSASKPSLPPGRGWPSGKSPFKKR